MSLAAITWSWTVKGLDPSTRLVLLSLADRTNKDTWECKPSHGTVAEDAEISVSTVRRSIKKLVDMGIVVSRERKRVSGDGGQTSNIYFLAVALEGRSPDGRCQFEGLDRPSKLNMGGTHSAEHPSPSNGEHPKDRLEGTVESKDSLENPPELPLGLEPIPKKEVTPLELAAFIASEWVTRAHATPLRGGRPSEANVEKAMKLALEAAVEGQTPIDVWREIFGKVDGSDFLQGKVPGRDGRVPFKLTLSFLLEKRNFVKTLEGRFDGHSTGERRRGSTSQATGNFLNRLRSGQGRGSGGGDTGRAVARR